MNTRTKILSGVALTGALLLLGVGAAHSQPPGRGGGGFDRAGFHHPHGGPGPGFGLHGDPMRYVLRHLDLSSAQEDQIEALRDANKPIVEALHETLMTARQELHQLVLSGTYTSEAAELPVQAIAKASGDFARLHAKMGSEVWAILTAEQREELADKLN